MVGQFNFSILPRVLTGFFIGILLPNYEKNNFNHSIFSFDWLWF